MTSLALMALLEQHAYYFGVSTRGLARLDHHRPAGGLDRGADHSRTRFRLHRRYHFRFDWSRHRRPGFSRRLQIPAWGFWGSLAAATVGAASCSSR